MGTLLYGTPPSGFEMDDRLLGHLKPVIVSKLRRGEAFLLSWDTSLQDGSGRWSLWVHPSIPLQFRFAGNRPPALNREWLDALNLAAGSADGLRVVPEPGVAPTTGGAQITVRRPSAT